MVEPHLLVAVRFHSDSRGLWHKEHRAPTQVPRIFSGIPSVRTQLVHFWPYLPTFWIFGSLHLPAVTSAIPGLNSDLDVSFPPAVTSASEVLTQTYRSSGLVRCWAQNPKVREEQSCMSACRIVRQCRTNRQPKERSRRSRFCTS